jgi:hypothetical protein
VLAVVAGTVDALEARLRSVSADAMRHAAAVVAEIISRVRAARATSPRTLRGDSGLPEEAWIPIPCVLDGAEPAETTCGPRCQACPSDRAPGPARSEARPPPGASEDPPPRVRVLRALR